MTTDNNTNEKLQELRFCIERTKALLYQSQIVYSIEKQCPEALGSLNHPARPTLEQISSRVTTLQNKLKESETLYQEIQFIQTKQAIHQRLSKQRKNRKTEYGF